MTPQLAQKSKLNFYACLLGLLFLAGCAASEPPRTITLTEIKEVKVPVPVKREVPAALTEPLDAARPVFVAPDDPQATSALTPDGERALRGLLTELKGRLDAFLAWAAAD